MIFVYGHGSNISTSALCRYTCNRLLWIYSLYSGMDTFHLFIIHRLKSKERNKRILIIIQMKKLSETVWVCRKKNWDIKNNNILKKSLHSFSVRLWICIVFLFWIFQWLFRFHDLYEFQKNNHYNNLKVDRYFSQLISYLNRIQVQLLVHFMFHK